LGFARVLAGAPPVLLLDEPTSGLDAATEAHVVSGITSLMRGRTTVMITHSMALARSADLVAVVADGRVVELADPATLLARDSTFRRMWETQQAGTSGAGRHRLPSGGLSAVSTTSPDVPTAVRAAGSAP